MLLNLFVYVGDILGLALTGSILSELNLKMATFVHPSSCGGGHKRLRKSLWTTELQWQVQMTFYFIFTLKVSDPFLSLSNQSVRFQFRGFELVHVMFRLKTLIWCYSSFFFHIRPVAEPSHFVCICMAALYQASCCRPFLLFNSNHYFQRKTAPLLSVHTERRQVPVQHPLRLLVFLSLLFFLFFYTGDK